MEFKSCTKCKMSLSIDNFSYKNKKTNKRNCYCRDCQSTYKKTRYYSNKQKYLSKTKAQKEKLKLWWFDFKKQFKCCHCNENHPACLQFHHLDEKLKANNVSQMIGRSKEKLFEEINKCIVLCSNCHAKLHWNKNHADVAQLAES